MLTLVLGVEAATLVVLATTTHLDQVTTRSWIWFGLLSTAAVIHLEAARGIERIREIAADGTPYTHMQSVWFFAGVLLLPLPLITALILISFSHEWWRVFRGRAVVYRKVYSACTVVLGCGAAVLALGAFYPGAGQPYAAVVDGPLGLAAVLVAGLLYRLVNYALIVTAIVVTNPDRPARTALGHPSDQLIIAASIGLGHAVTTVVVERPWSMPLLLVTVLALHLGLLLPQFRTAARTDGKTGLVDATFWNDVAVRELDRARRLSSSLGVLLVDLDHFKHINDRYGHLAGDEVLKAVATALRQVVRGHDLVGRFGGEEFAVLLPGVDTGAAEAAAERVRATISVLTVRVVDRSGSPQTIAGLTCSVGAAVYPETAKELSPLLLAADEALYQAKNTGRDRTRVALVPDTRRPSD
ncbi:GGDEF domain-containing protein [Umezawaea beigongshangensis]|uniref:GGDEF domain-containing protein n=1 Tax=Umezawaea beigongshangensis TaxID=2780383 RepID=UPI0027DC9FFF|nr:GGDEF domain-containing protein [Umezawaea beigongshangensis]